MKRKVFIIADYFIAKNNQSKTVLTNKKLQKLLYYAQAWHLVFKDRKLFSEEIEAWIHGPAIPAVYSKFKDFGFKNIDIEINEREFSFLTQEEKDLLDAIWGVYGKYDADYLEVLTHNEDPWLKTRNSTPPYESSNEVIPLSLMREYYGRQISK